MCFHVQYMMERYEAFTVVGLVVSVLLVNDKNGINRYCTLRYYRYGFVLFCFGNKHHMERPKEQMQ